MTSTELEILVFDLARLPAETEWVEFKENRAEPREIGEYISALANSAALLGKSRGFVVWGIRDGSHDIVGTSFRPRERKVGNEDLEPWLARGLNPTLDFRFHEGSVGGTPVVVLEVPAAGHSPIGFENDRFVRVGSYNKKLRDHPEKERALWQSFDRIPFEQGIALEAVQGSQVLELLDWARYFELIDLPIPGDPVGTLRRLEDERMITATTGGRYHITNLGAISFGKDLEKLGVGRKAIRVIVYKGTDRIETVRERKGQYGYGATFERLIDYVNSQLPTNEHIGKALRTTHPMYPEVAVRELVANALIHQDLYMTGTGPMIEIFMDRVEITNPGVPLIEPLRFIDAPPKSRNEALAALMRRISICEERGSGVDKVVSLAEVFQLPAPDFQVTESHTRVVLYAPRPLSAMSKADRIRACYQHAALQYVSGRQMTNTTLRERFKISPQNYAMASRIVRDSIAAGVIKPFDPSNRSKKHAKYVPYWA
ncbi:MAG TPA: ATP-binding protein [Longimicrobium sp.]|nr:ATP-binding protein [Longimicrobium sp.]